MEIRYGLIPDMSGSQTLLRLLRPDLARELIYTGRIVHADEAAQIGLVTRIAADPHADALALARRSASSTPVPSACGLCCDWAMREAPA